MAQLNERAARGFAAQAEAYERARPEYPAAAVDLVVAGLGLGDGSRVVDLAAGTGKLTRALVGRGFDLVAVEPIDEMRAQLERALPEVAVLSGLAEELPFADASVDAVFVAQAFHWFDPSAAAIEIHRVLRPGGGLALVWNVNHYDEGWLAGLGPIYARLRADTPGTPSWRTYAWREPLLATGLFGPLQEASLANDVVFTPERVLERVASVSFVGSLPDAEREAVLAEVRELLATHPETRGRAELLWSHHTQVFWCRAR